MASRASVAKRRHTSTNKEVIQQLRDFREIGKNELLTASLDSLEKTLFTQFYGKKEEKVSDKNTIKKEVVKQVPIEELIQKFFKLNSDPLASFELINIPHLRRIARYLGEFQPKPEVVKEKLVDKKIKGVNWKQQENVQKFSAEAKGLKVDERAPWTGPGSYGPSRHFGKIYRPHGICHRVYVERPKKDKFPLTPGPGTYGAPDKPSQKCTSLLPSFEWAAEGRGKVNVEGLPPNVYDIKGQSMYEKVQKSVTKRGPYDVFTGPRDGTTIKNKFSPPKLPDLKSWPKQFPGVVDEFTHYAKMHFGRWGRRKRDFLSNLNNLWTPGPNTYQSTLVMRKDKQNKYPFNISTQWPRDGPLPPLLPGPGRYSIAVKKRSLASKKSAGKKSSRPKTAKKSPGSKTASADKSE